MLAIVAMAVLGIIGGAFVFLSSSEAVMAANFRDGTAAQYLAEAGARRGIVELAKYTGWSGTHGNVLLGSGEYSVEVVTDSNGTRLESTGTVGTVNKVTRKVVLRLQMGTPASINGVYNYAIFSGGNFNMGNNAVVYGSIGSNSIINLNNNAKIRKTSTGKGGDVWSYDKVNTGNNVTVEGAIIDKNSDTDPNRKPLVIPNFNIDSYKPNLSGATLWRNSQNDNNLDINSNFTRGAGTYNVNGDMKVNATLTCTGDINLYVNSNMSIGNNSVVNFTGGSTVNIFVNGDLTLNNNSSINFANSTGKNVNIYVKNNLNVNNNAAISGEVTILVNGGVNIGNNAEINKALLIAKQNISLSQNMLFTGCMITQGVINDSNNAKVTYDYDFIGRALSNHPELVVSNSGGSGGSSGSGSSAGSIKITSWSYY
ncbi:hypothetical protein SCACP_14530 [Sporomusa carbonis]|uniref:pilus assembly PilX N-terminal domain-containing protein n=1 Tax=Sporomusa carbonis TaxID=3076075 RepID=UPI003A601213